MKKLLLLLGVFAFISNFASAAETQGYKINTTHSVIIKERAQRDAAFEKKLGLTEEQKFEAKIVRKKGHEQMKPVMDKIMAKRQEINKIRHLQKDYNDKKLTKLNNDIKSLEKKANKIRQQNMKEFEKILTDEQKNILKQMKQEGRRKYQENHPPCHKVPFGFPPERRF